MTASSSHEFFSSHIHGVFNLDDSWSFACHLPTPFFIPSPFQEALEANASRLSSQLAEKESTIESLRRAAEEAETEVAALREELGLKEDELAKVGVELKKGWECLGSNSDSTSGIDSPRSVAGQKWNEISSEEEGGGFGGFFPWHS